MAENTEIIRFLPKERLSSFKRSPQASLESQLDCYFWNLELTESLYPSLSLLEVALRNQLHGVISQAFEPNWYETILQPFELKKVEEAKDAIVRERKELKEGRIIAELSFGFWTGLFKSRYEQVLWPKLTKEVFPYAPKREQYRKTLFERLERIRHLRNRAFHHEPLWKGIGFNRLSYPLDILHQEIQELLQWMSPELDVRLHTIDRFTLVFNNKPLL